MSLSTPISVQKLQTALHAKAKGSPDLRFYTVYDKMNRTDVLAFAYDCCRANRGAAGVDDQAFDDIEAYGRERWLGELTEPTGRCISTFGIGSVSGCAPSTKCKAREANGLRIGTCTMCWVWSVYRSGPPTSRGRKREAFSESRMREIRTSGSMSGM